MPDEVSTVFELFKLSVLDVMVRDGLLFLDICFEFDHNTVIPVCEAIDSLSVHKYSPLFIVIVLKKHNRIRYSFK